MGVFIEVLDENGNLLKEDYRSDETIFTHGVAFERRYWVQDDDRSYRLVSVSAPDLRGEITVRLTRRADLN